MTSTRSLRRPRVLGAVAALAALALAVTACSSSSAGKASTTTVTKTPSSSSTGSTTGAASTTPSTSSSAAAPTKPVHVSTALSDGQQVGVGMPFIAFLSKPIKDAKAFAAATKVTVNGKPVNGGWYFEYKSGYQGHPIEADWRMATYWPGHANIHMDIPVKGLSAGPGLAFDDDLTLNFSTGAADVLTVDNSTHRLTVMRDGKKWGTFPVSLGASNTPTKRGVKVIMEKGLDIPMKGPGYYDPHVKLTQRLTYSGEYLHSAPWNVHNIDNGVNSSNGCTNLLPADAKKLYSLLEIGDVVNYPNATGPRMTMGDGYGDWNVPWSQWKTGGLYPVS